MNLESFKYIDCHTHLNFTHFDHDQDKVIAEMKEQEIGAINVGIDDETSKESITLAENHEYIWASAGCHPTEATDDFSIDPYGELINEFEQVVAVGECGLDYSRSEYRTDKQKQLQEDVFIAQIKLAAKVDLPLILHIRPQEQSMDAYEDALDILSHFQSKLDTDVTGTAHFFVGSEEIAKRFLELGFYVSFTGPLTFDQRLQDVCSYIPADRVLAETDSPFAAPKPHRGKRNTPLFVPEIVSRIADCHDTNEATMREQIMQNTKNLFGLTS